MNQVRSGAFKILIIGNDAVAEGAVVRWLKQQGFMIDLAHDLQTANQHLRDGRSLVIHDLDTPILNSNNSLEILENAQRESSHVDFLALTGSLETAIQSLYLGAADYLIKPVNLRELSIKVKRILRRRDLINEAIELKVKLNDRNVDLGSPTVDLVPFTNGTQMSLQEMECKAICASLHRHNGQRKKTAAALGISVRTLQRKIKQFDIDPKLPLQTAACN